MPSLDLLVVGRSYFVAACDEWMLARMLAFFVPAAALATFQPSNGEDRPTFVRIELQF
jgi:hypothetical protein